jgi:hypothetical protein
MEAKIKLHLGNETHGYHDNIVENPDNFNRFASSLVGGPNSRADGHKFDSPNSVSN